jgi:LuxR family maltose regulon positive regulatory protein
MKAVKHPLVAVCAGAGYGKTSAVHDFVEEYKVTTVWIPLCEHDNVDTRFLENLIHDHVDTKRRIIIMDDFHVIEEPSVLRFIEEYILHKMPPGTSFFLVSRSIPRINTAGLISRGRMFNINEDDLRFTDGELANYFREHNISPRPESLREIMRDTGGWAFAVNLIARSYQKAPGYDGYLRKAMKTDIFRLMEAEIWNGISKELQNFLVCLSLIGHLSVDLVSLLAGGNSGLVAEMEKQHAYVSRDAYINAYLIHPLFLEFLTAKQETLSETQKRKTYTIAGDWCGKNGFTIDALSYFEKIKDYKSIVSILSELPVQQIPPDIAKFAAIICDRSPPTAYDTVDRLAVIHIRAHMCQGLWNKAVELAEFYEKKYLKLPANDVFGKRNLGGIYYCWAISRALMALTDDTYDFNRYLEKSINCVSNLTNPPKLPVHSTGPWIIFAGTSRKGAPEECIEAISRTVACLSRRSGGRMSGEDELARGELNFYRGDTRVAETFIVRSLETAREKRQFEIEHRALFYSLRIAVSQGNYARAEQVLKDIKAQLDNDEYTNRFINYDISLAWYYHILGLPDKIPDWLKENFSPYGYASFIENFGNQMKARFCYSTRNYPPLLSYIQQMKKRESYLFGRVEMLAMEACAHYKMKNKDRAFAVLREAFKTASPNGILMPFIELGKDMRTLAIVALKEGVRIPKPWLEEINRKSALYAKHQNCVIAEYRQANGMENDIYLSPREMETVTDLCHGLSRAEIAANRNISINTVKKLIGNIYSKLGAKNLAELIRTATERKII